MSRQSHHERRYCADCGVELPPEPQWATVLGGAIAAGITTGLLLLGMLTGPWSRICNQCAGEAEDER
jgi:hypothetical protein